MSTLYWLRLAEHTDVFTQGYVGVAQDLQKRLRSHKHRFKSIWDSVIATPLVVASDDYCFDLEKKLRPVRRIGWNKSPGGYRNNAMHGKANPNFGKIGEDAPNFIGWYITPLGRFARPKDAAKMHGCFSTTIIRRCRGRISNGKKLPPMSGYAFEQKGGVKS
jgi:hypothetical protein